MTVPESMLEHATQEVTVIVYGKYGEWDSYELLTLGDELSINQGPGEHIKVHEIKRAVLEDTLADYGLKITDCKDSASDND